MDTADKKTLFTMLKIVGIAIAAVVVIYVVRLLV